MNYRSDLDALILAVIVGSPAHGYEITRRISSRDPEILKIGEGQLYPALKKLEESGWVQAEWVQTEGRPAKRIYSLTDAGLGELEKRRTNWTRFASAVNSLFDSPKPEVNHG